MKIALCNEVLSHLTFEKQCAYCASLGYDGLEVAPYTLATDPSVLTEKELSNYRQMAGDQGLHITGLHWLLLAPEGLSIVDPDPGVRSRTLDMAARLVDMCAALGGDVLVHGSPRQRLLGDDPEADRARAEEYFAFAGNLAAKTGVTYCIEPLSREETNYINTVAEGAELVRSINQPGLKTMLDTSAAARTEELSVAEVLQQWLPTGLLGHIQINDRNRRAPGQGEDRFRPILETLLQHGWSRPVSVEPFVYEPDGAATAARAIGYLQGILEGLE